MEKDQQELIFKLSMFEQQMQQMQQQLQAVEQGITELNMLNRGLDDLKSSVNRDILAPIGRGVFAKAKLLSEDLVVDIGNKTLIKKTIPETQKIINEQTEKLEEVKIELNNNLQDLGGEFNKIILESRQIKEKE